MELAVKVMRQSVAEGRDDRKTSPLVGAVLVKPDGSVATAHRGELREGDHAEYTLLERKQRDARLDGSVLFATLEPCAPGARKHPKLSCAERIVNARIKEVWVGIEDPDPTVDRQGLRFLESKKVTVHMFDPELQDEIRQANHSFLVQAAKRAAEAKNLPANPKALSDWERVLPGAESRDLSTVALKSFRNKIGRRLSAAGFSRLLVRQGFLAKSGRKTAPTGWGYLLFGTAPRDLLPQAGLKGTIHYPDGREEVRDFDEPLILIPDLVEAWLRDKLPFASDRSHMTRQDSSVAPFEIVREAVINALVHRDYDVRGATCHVAASADTVTVRSPGVPPTPISLGQLQALQAPMLNRNPKLQLAFAGASLAEGRGLGMRTFNEAATKYGLPLPRYAFDGVYLNLTIYRDAKGVVRLLRREVLERLNSDEKESWQVILTKQPMTSAEMMTVTGFDERKAQRVLRKLLDKGLVRRVGKGRATQYTAVGP